MKPGSATASRAADRTVDRGSVIRESDPVDQRLVLCRVSDRGNELIEGFWQPALKHAEMMLTELGRSKLFAVGASLKAPLETGEAAKERLPLI